MDLREVMAVMAIEDLIEEVSEGDEMAKGVCHLISRLATADQEKFEVGIFSTMKSLGIRGHRIVVLWDTVSERDTIRMINVIQAYRRGELSAEKINKYIDVR